MFHIVTLSVQSTDNAVLRAIGRKNLDFDAFHESIEAYVSNGIQPFTELILGLPEETYDSFCEGFEKLILAGQKYYVEVYRCYILPNALLGRPETVERYGIKTVFTPPVMHHIPLEDANHMQPSARIVVETASMSNSEWVRANLFAVLVQALYYMGTLKRVADHLHDIKGVSYRSLFEGILQWGLCHPERFTGTILKKLSEIFQNFSEGTGHLHYYNPAFGDIVWFVEEGLFLEIAAHTQAFYEDMIDYLKESRFDDDLCEEMLRYQLFMLYAPQRKKFSAEFHYDFRESVPKPQNILVTVDQNICYDSLADYAREVVWFKRKSGGTICSENNCSIRYEVQ